MNPHSKKLGNYGVIINEDGRLEAMPMDEAIKREILMSNVTREEAEKHVKDANDILGYK